MSATEREDLISHYRNSVLRFRAIETRADVELDWKIIAGENASRLEEEIAHLEKQK